MIQRAEYIIQLAYLFFHEEVEYFGIGIWFGLNALQSSVDTKE